MTHDPSQSPWYKQIWAWFIIAILAFAVFIGIGLERAAIRCAFRAGRARRAEGFELEVG